jgi:hypothetical protein
MKMKWFKHWGFILGFAVYDYPSKCSIEVFLGKRTWQITFGGSRA